MGPRYSFLTWVIYLKGKWFYLNSPIPGSTLYFSIFCRNFLNSESIYYERGKEKERECVRERVRDRLREREVKRERLRERG